MEAKMRKLVAGLSGAAMVVLAGGAFGAELAIGAVDEYDEAEKVVTLRSGAQFYLGDEGLDDDVAVGERIRITFEVRDGRNVVLGIDPYDIYEAIGVIANIDRAANLLVLRSGARFQLGVDFDFEDFGLDDMVRVRFTRGPGGNVAKNIGPFDPDDN